MSSSVIRVVGFTACLCTSPILFSAGALSCINLKKTTGGWNGAISLSNQCGKSIDLRDGLIEFQSNEALQGSYWGSFSPLAYPSNPAISSEPISGGYLVKIPLTFPTGSQWWKPNTTLPNGSQINVQFSTRPSTTISQLAFYPVATQTVEKGQISLQFPPAPNQAISNPSTITISGSSFSKDITNGAWGQAYVVKDIPYGSYQINVQPIENAYGTWSGNAAPTTVSLNSTAQQNVNINYQQSVEYGQINVTLNQAKPEQSLAAPVLKIKDLTTGSFLPSQTIDWAGQATINYLEVGHSYQIITDTLYGSEYSYIANLAPSDTAYVNSSDTKQINLSFNQEPLPMATVKMAVSGLPDGQSAAITAKDNVGHTFNKTINKDGDSDWSLPVNRQYQFSAAAINVNDKMYKAQIEPNALLLQPDSSPQITVLYQEKTASSMQFSPYVDVTLGAVAKWDSNTGSMQPLGLLDIVQNSGVKSLHLAFITARNGCEATWAGYPVGANDSDFGVPVFKKLKEQDVELRVALGGLSGTYLAQACDTPEALFNAYDNIIQAYNPDALDFDVENTMQTNNAQLDRMMQAIKKVQQKYPNIQISFTLPVMPSGLVPGVGENVIKRAQVNGLDDYVVNIMAMDYGPSFVNKSMGEYAIDAATATFNQLKALYPNQSDEVLWQRIGITPMIGLNDTIPLNFSLTDVDKLKQFADEKQLGGLAVWSINRDHSCSSNYVSITCTSVNPDTGAPNQSKDYEYSQRFSQ